MDLERLRRALEIANLPSLLMVMYQLTGDEKWVQLPYRPTRTRGLSDHDYGGFSDSVQGDIRIAAEKILVAWSAGTPVAIAKPRGEKLLELMSCCVGEVVPSEFEPMMAQEMGFDESQRPDRNDVKSTNYAHEISGHFRVVIMGAGVSGLLAARKLQEMGVPFVILEKNSDLGGTWLENTYPGCGVDTPSHLYSYSFFRRKWSTYFGRRDEVIDYLRDVADDTSLEDFIEFDTEVTAATYDSARQEWALTASTRGVQREFVANFVISAVGQLNQPYIPELPGIEEYRGKVFHSSNWPKDLDVTGIRVAVVGSAATAMQIVPAIVESVSQLTLFQRSPQWIAPTENYFRQVGPDMQWLMEEIPFYYEWYRFRLAWIFGDRMHSSLQIDPSWPHPERSVNAINDAHRRLFTEYLRSELAGREDLIEKSLPTYPPFGKRMLLDNGWFAALKHSNVELIDEAMIAFTETGVLSASGLERSADVVVFATGFEAKRFFHPMEIRGRSGRSIREIWGDDDGRAFMGMTIPDFPNFAVMYGPNTNLGHGGSYIFIAECQVRYIVGLIEKMITEHIGVIECREEVNDAYNKKVDEAHQRMIYSHSGMDTWYRNSKGRVVTNSPWRVVDYWHMTHEPNLDAYEVESKIHGRAKESAVGGAD